MSYADPFGAIGAARTPSLSFVKCSIIASIACVGIAILAHSKKSAARRASTKRASLNRSTTNPAPAVASQPVANTVGSSGFKWNADGCGALWDGCVAIMDDSGDLWIADPDGKLRRHQRES